MMRADEDVVTTKPIIALENGRAWSVDIDAGYRRLGKTRIQGGDVAHWIVEAPWAHPFWHSYIISLQHLRHFEGQPKEPVIYLAGATHEMWVHALDPDEPRQPQIECIHAFRFLTPKNFAAQFIEPDDASAMQRVERSVRAICEGKLSPDTDFLSAWAELYGGNMLR